MTIKKKKTIIPNNTDVVKVLLCTRQVVKEEEKVGGAGEGWDRAIVGGTSKKKTNICAATSEGRTHNGTTPVVKE